MQKLILTFSFLFCLIPLWSQWTQLNDIPFFNHHSNGFGLNGKGYIIQGIPDGFQNTMWEYEPQADSWTSLGLVPGPGREFSIGDDLDGKYYFGFGIGLADLWEFDPATNSYTQLPSCPCTPRYHPAFVAHEGKIYMGAGSSANGDLNDWWIYDLATQEWTQKTNIPGGRRHHTFQFGIDGAIYVGGGHVSNWIKWDIATEQWSAFNDMPSSRVAGTQFSYDGRGFVLSGDRVDHEPLTGQQFLMYEPDEDEWYELPFEETQHRWAGSSMIIEDELYYFGGRGDFGSNFRMWKFDLGMVDCLPPSNPYAASTAENSAELLWTSSRNGMTDTLQWRVAGETEWNTQLNPQSGLTLDGLESCTEYEFRVNVSCDPTQSVYSDIGTFKTFGCGSCVDFDFCDVSDDFRALSVYLERVRIKNFDNQTGGAALQGYHSYTAFDKVQVRPNELFEVEIEPTFTSALRRASTKAWIDFDGDGEFENDEVVLEEVNFDSILLKNVEVPVDAAPGIVRMRVMIELQALTTACRGTAFQDGEVEDYCITILEGSSDVDDNAGDAFGDVRIFPNPNDGVFNLEYSAGERYEIFDYSGRLVAEGNLTLAASAAKNKSVEKIETIGLTPGLYLVKVIGEEQVGTVSFIKK